MERAARRFFWDRCRVIITRLVISTVDFVLGEQQQKGITDPAR